MRIRKMLIAVAIGFCLMFLLVGCASGHQEADLAPEPEAPKEEVVPEEEQPAPSTTAVARPSTSGALHVEGTQLVDKDGNPVVLFGVSTHGLAWFPQYVNADLFGELSGWGANVMRLALYTDEYGGWCSGGDRDALLKLVLDGVDFATAADQYVIVDWHILSDNNPQLHADDAKAFFADITATLADHDNVLYEICNEPNGATTWEDVRSYAQEIIPIIRANDPDAVIIVGTPEWSQRVDQAAENPLDEKNVMYALHFYAATHTDDLRNRMASAVQAGLPVFVSEFGICDASGNGAIDEQQADQWLAVMDELGISRVMWNLSNKDESSAMIQSSTDKVSGLDDADLSQAGRWLKARLAGEWETPEVTLPEQGAAASGSSTPAATATFSQGSLTVNARVANSWPVEGATCYQYVLTVTNEGEACDSWHVDVPFAGDIAFVDGWNGTYAANGSVLPIDNASYNGHLEPGQSASDVGFQVTGPGAGTIKP